MPKEMVESNRFHIFGSKKVPSKCNILGISYRSVGMFISSILLLQNISFVASNVLREVVPCYIYTRGIYSLIIQFGNKCWSLAGLLIAIFCVATNASLLVGAKWNIKNLILLWYGGSIIQFVYLISLQSFCYATKSCNNNCEMDRLTKKYYHWGFGLCIFLTLYLYLTFFQKVYLLYKYVQYKYYPSDSLLSRNQISIHTFYYGKVNKATQHDTIYRDNFLV